MQIQFNTGVCTLLLVKVPEHSFDLSSEGTLLNFWQQYSTCSSLRTQYLRIGNWTFIGLSHELTEDQCMTLVEASEYYDPHAQPYPIPCYKGYDDNIWKWTAKESFESLCRHLKVYNVNPYGEKEPSDIPDLGAFTQSRRELWRKWKDAQETVGTWAVLKLEE